MPARPAMASPRVLRVGLPMLPAALPCNPCPHASACCRHGTSLTEAEARAIAAVHGAAAIRVLPDDLRTAVTAHGCAFLDGEGCRIHGERYYPATCRDFPWRDRDGGPYQGDLSVCPELEAAGGG